MYYLSANGPLDFEVKPTEDGSLAFTSNCDLETADKRNGVFDDLTLYVDEALTEEACSLSEGMVFDGLLGLRVIRNEGDPFTDLEGYYSIEAPGLADQCNGHEMTYVRVQSRRILGGNHTFVPIRAFMTPSTSTP